MKNTATLLAVLVMILSGVLSAGCGDEGSAPTHTDCLDPETPCPMGSFCATTVDGEMACLVEMDVAPNGEPASNQFPAPPLGQNHGDPPASGGPQNAGDEDEDDEGQWSRFGDGADDDSDSTDQGTDTGTGSSCPELRLRLKPSARSIPRVMLVVDRSYSMIVEQDRWTPTERTLRQVTEALGDQVHFGLVLFPSPTVTSSGLPPQAARACAPGQINVEPNADTSDQIGEWLLNGPPEPDLATPTYSALQAAGAALSRNPTGNDYILLATDGGPGCNFQMNADTCTCLNHSCLLGVPEMCLDDQRTVGQVEALADQGIKTMVLGMTGGNLIPEARSVLDRMAVAGQTALNGEHFSAEAVGDLEQALAARAGSVASCEYDLGPLADYVGTLEVSIDSQSVTRDSNHNDGWDEVDGHLTFFGHACTALRDGQAHSISARCH